jgi:hypothetical protein
VALVQNTNYPVKVMDLEERILLCSYGRRLLERRRVPLLL